jgi:hypothetical protein
MTKETPSEFSFQVRRDARRLHVVASARGAPAKVLAFAVLVFAVAIAVYCLRAPVLSMGQPSMGQRSMPPPPVELPMAVSGSATSQVISTPLPAGASLVLMPRTSPASRAVAP